MTPPDRDPNVSLLLLMKNHRDYMERSLEVIRGQEFSGQLEIVYIDSGSTDGSIEFMREHGVEAVEIPPGQFHHARTRNLAAERAQHDLLVLLSADAVPTNRRWLRSLTRHFADPEVGAVYGKQSAPEGMGALRTRALAYQYPDAPDVRQLDSSGAIPMASIRFSNANSAVRRGLWQRHRFFERALVAEDHWIAYNALKEGLKVVYEPEAEVVHGHERNLWGEFQFAVDNGVSLKRMGILDDPALSSAARYGLARIRDDWRHFAGQGRYGLALNSLAVSAVKLAGVQVGKREAFFPRWFMERCSALMKRFDRPVE